MKTRKVSRAKNPSPRATRVGYLDPVVDAYQDVHRACTKYLRNKGLIKEHPFKFGDYNKTKQ